MAVNILGDVGEVLLAGTYVVLMGILVGMLIDDILRYWNSR